MSAKKGGQPTWVAWKESNFELPRNVIKAVRKCAEGHPCDCMSHDDSALKYLWINMSGDANPVIKPRVEGALTLEDWLNVIDEAASLGVCCVVIGIGNSFGKYPYLWNICRWAQETHNINIGLHTCCAQMTPAVLNELHTLDRTRTWLFVSKKHIDAMQLLKNDGFRICESEVCHEDHHPPCDMPESMVFVGPEGQLYSCGLVLGNDEFRLGHVLDEPLAKVLGNPERSRAIPKDAPYIEHACDACPPLMAQRILHDSV